MKKVSILIAGIAALCLLGCSAGDAPAGMSAEEAKAAVAKMPPEQRIKAIAGSPMPQAQKEAEYAKIESATGVKAADVLGKSVPGRQ
jgi:hypothetical protein